MQQPTNPSYIVINHSGGKDSTILLALMVEKYQGQVPIIAHHQLLPEAWAGTEDYCQKTCDALGVPLIIEQAFYMGYECSECHTRWLSATPKVKCRGCGSLAGRHIATIRGLVDLMNWRKMWPSPSIRWCTSYLKRDLFNKWARRNREMLGANPVNCMGERWLESTGRSKLPYLMNRPGLEWMIDYKPILHLKRIEVFQGLRARGIDPHWCYAAQGMTAQDMYETDVEGGPRCSCVCCIYLTPENIAENLTMEENQALAGQLVAAEETSQFYFRKDLSIKTLINRKRVA